MDDSWRIAIGSTVPRRRSTDQDRRSRWGAGSPALDPGDFHDVFGGPPRSVLLRQFSGDLAAGAGEFRPVSFYDEVFRRAAETPERSGRSLPGFRIPAAVVRTEEGFYDDIFGVGSDQGEERRSRSRSKSKSKSKTDSSSSVLSSVDVSPPPLRPAIGVEDGVLSSVAPKLRPITIPPRHHCSSPPSPTLSGGDRSCCSTRTLTIPCPMGLTMATTDRGSSSSSTSAVNFFRRHLLPPHSSCFSPPETISRPDAGLYIRRKAAGAKIPEPGSPSSVISSMRDVEKVVIQGEEEEAVGSSFIIQMNCGGGHHDLGEGEVPTAVDEAIAWAKQKFLSQVDGDGSAVGKEETQSKDNKDYFEVPTEKREARQFEGISPL